MQKGVFLLALFAAWGLGARPNVVWFVIDDVGWADVSLRNASNDIATPVMDSLAKSGVLLDR